MPDEFKTFQTIKVKLTQPPDEEQLKAHYEKMVADWHVYANDSYVRLQDVLERNRESNPYARGSWRSLYDDSFYKSYPTRKYEKGYEWEVEKCSYEEREAKMERDSKFMYLTRELNMCVKHYEWKEDWIQNYLYRLEQDRATTKQMREELVRLDEHNFNSAKKQWHEDNAEWIERKKLEKAHRSHKPRSYYIERMRLDKDEREWYERNGIPDNEDTCPMCILDKKQREEQEEQRRQAEEEERKQREADEEARRLRMEEERKNFVPYVPVVRRCECCNYETTVGLLYDSHLKSVQHERNARREALFCKTCNQQCRSKTEYEHHLTTNKHKKGGIEEPKDEYKCECCNYTTPIKQNFVLHLKSKKHQKNASQVVEIPILAVE